jgi:hypothetical protein
MIRSAILIIGIISLAFCSGCVDDGYTYQVSGTVSNIINHNSGIGSGPCTVRMDSGKVYDVRYYSNCVNLTKGANVSLSVYQRFNDGLGPEWVSLVEVLP